jgi:hypothetical protein
MARASDEGRGWSLKAILSRIWLVLISIIFIAMGLLLGVGGYAILQISKQTTSKDHFLADFNMKPIAYIVFGLGGFFLLTGLSGLCGGLCNVVSFLLFYIGCTVLNLLLVISGGIFALIKTMQRKNEWEGYTLDDWILLPDSAKDFTQQAVYWILI